MLVLALFIVSFSFFFNQEDKINLLVIVAHSEYSDTPIGCI